MYNFLSSFGSFLSVVIIAWITQRIVSYHDEKKKIAETKLAIFMSWMPHLAEWYVEAIAPSNTFSPKTFFKKRLEILGVLQIMGPDEAMDSFEEFCSLAERGIKQDPAFDGAKLHSSFTNLNYHFCCEIHREKIRPKKMIPPSVLAAISRL